MVLVYTYYSMSFRDEYFAPRSMFRSGCEAYGFSQALGSRYEREDKDVGYFIVMISTSTESETTSNDFPLKHDCCKYWRTKAVFSCELYN